MVILTSKRLNFIRVHGKPVNKGPEANSRGKFLYTDLTACIYTPLFEVVIECVDFVFVYILVLPTTLV